MLPLSDWQSHACKQKAYIFFLQGHQSVSFHLVHTLEAHSCSKGSLACDPTAAQHKFMEPQHCRWLKGSQEGRDCSHEIKRRLLLGRKVMTNLDSIFKSRDVALPTQGHLVKAMVFRVVTYGCESWTVKKAERQRIDAFEL